MLTGQGQVDQAQQNRDPCGITLQPLTELYLHTGGHCQHRPLEPSIVFPSMHYEAVTVGMARASQTRCSREVQVHPPVLGARCSLVQPH